MAKHEAIQKALRQRYQSFLLRPAWSEDEIEDIAPHFQATIRLADAQTASLRTRLAWLLPADVAKAEDDFFVALVRAQLREREAA